MQPDPAGANLSGEERQRLIEQLSGRFSASGIRKRRRGRAFQATAWLIWVQIVTGAKRAVDFFVASFLLVVLSPLLVVQYAVAKSRGGGLARSARLGRWGLVYREFSFTRAPLKSLPALMNVWRGEMSLVGPRSVSPGEVSAAGRAAWRRFSIRPGLVCLWWIRQRANIAYGSELEADAEYVDTHSVWGDLAIGLRAIPAAFFGEGIALAPARIEFLGIPVDNLTMDEAVAAIAARAVETVPSQVAFINADCVNISCRDAQYKKILCASRMVLADGIGVKLAGRLLNNNIRQNVNGTDLFPRLCAAMETEGLGLYLLGGKPGVAADVSRWIASHYPGLPVRGSHHGYFSSEETPGVLAAIRASGASILLVAFGVPRQERWIAENLPDLGVNVAIGVGGLFDFYSGRIQRAPLWMREIGMEWFYRFLQEPRRMWRRYFVGNFVFLCRVLRHRFTEGAGA